METMSITISPRGDVPLEWGRLISEYFNKKRWAYYIGNERGSNDNSHLQIAVDTPFRSDNIRRLLMKLLKPDFADDHEKSCWLKISKTDDRAYTFGYCMKEKDIDNGDRIPARLFNWTNLSEEEIKEFDEYYNKRLSTKKPVGWECKSLNQLIDYCLDFARKNELINRNIKLRSIIVVLVNDGLIPFSLGRKIRKEDELFWKDLINIELGSKDILGEDSKPTALERINSINDYYE